MKTLFDKTRIGNMNLKNRIFRSATSENLAYEGHLTKQLYKVYEDLANGGVGTIITSFTYIVQSEHPFPGMMGIYDDSFIEEYKKLTDMVHSHETNIILEIVYCGSFTMSNVEQEEILAPSPIVNLFTKVQPKEMTKDDISLLQKAFSDAALRAKQAGFDGIQIYAAHGFLLSQFLSPYYNRRTDEYGGPIENRARMVLETYDAVRQKVGAEYPIFVKINNSDAAGQTKGQGMTFEDCRYVCGKLAEMGINAIEISGDWLHFSPQQEAYFKEEAGKIAAEIDIPIILVGGNRNYHSMVETLNQTPIEYLSLARPLIAEPNLIKRWQNGDTSKAKCISCNACLNQAVSPKGIVGCFMNR